MRLRVIVFLLLVSLSGLTDQVLADCMESRIVHVVLVWLKEPGNQEHRAQVIEATRRFAEIPGIEEIRVGQPISSQRSMVDNSYDIGLYMTFVSTAALDTYLAHPVHKNAQRSVLRPLVSKVVVYDFEDNGTC